MSPGAAITWLDRFIPPGIVGDEGVDLVRARVLVVASGVMVCAGIWGSIDQGLWGSVGIAWVAALVGPLCGLIPFVLRRTGSLKLAGNLFLGQCFVSLVFVWFASGGQALGVYFVIAPIPAIAALVLGHRSAWGWLAGVCAAIVVGPMVRDFGAAPLASMVPDNTDSLVTRVPIFLTLCVASVALTFERAARKALGAAREARQEVELRERRHSQLLETLPDGVCTTRDGKILYANPALAQMVGIRDRSELTGRSVSEFVSRENERLVVMGPPMAQGGLSPPPFEMLVRAFDGTEVPVEVAAVSMPGSDGREYLSILRDLRERKEIDAELRLLGDVIEQASDGIVVLDAQLKTILYCNEAYGRITRNDPKKLVGCPVGALVKDTEGRRFVEEARKSILERGEEWSARYQSLRAGGRTVYREVRGMPVRNLAGEITHVVVFYRDVSQAVELEEQVRQSQKMEAIGRLSGGVAHDFNNLLTVILGRAELIGDRSQTAATQADARAIRDAAERSAAFTQRLLAFSRRQILDPRALSLNEVVQSMHDLLVRLIPESIVFDVDVDPDLPDVEADRLQIEQLILNLVVNARDADAKRIVVSTRSEGAPEEGHPGSALLSVSDDGSGMDEETRAKACEPFFTTKGSGGTGLGLSTAHGFVHQSGGLLEIDSAPGKGTIVSVRLPGIRAASPAPASSRTPEAVAEPRHVTILLVEDDEPVRALALVALEGAGHRVIVASDGEDALEKARMLVEIDLLVSDLVMPRLGGVELARQLNLERPGLSVLLVSGYAEDGGSDEPGTESFAFLRKPFKPTDLLAAVQKVLAESR